MDFPWNKPFSYWGAPILGNPHAFLGLMGLPPLKIGKLMNFKDVNLGIQHTSTAQNGGLRICRIWNMNHWKLRCHQENTILHGLKSQGKVTGNPWFLTPGNPDIPANMPFNSGIITSKLDKKRKLRNFVKFDPVQNWYNFDKNCKTGICLNKNESYKRTTGDKTTNNYCGMLYVQRPQKKTKMQITNISTSAQAEEKMTVLNPTTFNIGLVC